MSSIVKVSQEWQVFGSFVNGGRALGFEPQVWRRLPSQARHRAERNRVIGVQARPEGPLTLAPRLGPETGLFFLLFYFYVWLVIDPRLTLHSLGILAPYRPFSFSTGWPFFWEHLVRWGGLVEYGDRLLSQFQCSGWVGSLIATTAALLTCLYADVLVRSAGGVTCRPLFCWQFSGNISIR